MILTVTINPLLERRLVFDNVQPGSDNRSRSEYYTAGGKGINISRQLNCLGIENLALTFLGGNNGKIMRRIMTEENINFAVVQSKSETRSASLVFEEDQQRLTTYFGANSLITPEEAEEFKTKLGKMIENCDIVIFSGSSPSEAADDIFAYGIQQAHEHDKISVCDTYGPHLSKCIEAAPTILHNNISETAKSLNIPLQSREDIIKYLGYLYSKDVKQAYITNGGSVVYASNFGFTYQAQPPEIKTADETGSGDAFTAGIAYGLENAFTFEETLARAVALGAVNASSWETCKADRDTVFDLKDEVVISTIGKKINTVDDEEN